MEILHAVFGYWLWRASRLWRRRVGRSKGQAVAHAIRGWGSFGVSVTSRSRCKSWSGWTCGRGRHTSVQRLSGKIAGTQHAGTWHEGDSHRHVVHWRPWRIHRRHNAARHRQQQRAGREEKPRHRGLRRLRLSEQVDPEQRSKLHARVTPGVTEPSEAAGTRYPKSADVPYPVQLIK